MSRNNHIVRFTFKMNKILLIILIAVIAFFVYKFDFKVYVQKSAFRAQIQRLSVLVEKGTEKDKKLLNDKKQYFIKQFNLILSGKSSLKNTLNAETKKNKLRTLNIQLHQFIKKYKQKKN